MDKQIEEMASVIHDVAEAHHIIWCTELAKHLITKKGYRKASDVAREIFAEIEYLIWQNDTHPAGELTERIADLKKKYESEGENR